LNTTTSIGEAFGTEFLRFYYKGLFFPKNAKITNKIFTSCDFRQKFRKSKMAAAAILKKSKNVVVMDIIY